MEELRTYFEAHGKDEDMLEFVTPLARGVDDLQASTAWLMKNAMGDPDNAHCAQR